MINHPDTRRGAADLFGTVVGSNRLTSYFFGHGSERFYWFL